MSSSTSVSSRSSAFSPSRMRLNLASVARLTSIAIVASLFDRARQPRLFPRHRVAYVVVASRSAVLSAVAVSAFRLVVASVASFASQSLVGVPASIVIASIVASPAERTVPVLSSAFFHFASRVAIVEIVRVKKYSRVSLRSRSLRRSGRRKLLYRRFSSSASDCCVRRRFVATCGRLQHRNLRVFVGCRVDRARRVPINNGRRVDFFFSCFSTLLSFPGVELCSSASRRPADPRPLRSPH